MYSSIKEAMDSLNKATGGLSDEAKKQLISNLYMTGEYELSVVALMSLGIAGLDGPEIFQSIVPLEIRERYLDLRSTYDHPGARSLFFGDSELVAATGFGKPTMAVNIFSNSVQSGVKTLLISTENDVDYNLNRIQGSSQHISQAA